jgi:hypothetical protein
VTREQFEKLWSHSVTLLQRGFTSGSILTVDPEEAQVGGCTSYLKGSRE